jgi:hypothetical protein
VKSSFSDASIHVSSNPFVEPERFIQPPLRVFFCDIDSILSQLDCEPFAGHPHRDAEVYGLGGESVFVFVLEVRLDSEDALRFSPRNTASMTGS